MVRRLPADLPAGVSAVGGVVRDVDGVARRLGHDLGARVTAHPRFGTASIELPHGGRIDLVGARTETYDAPGALPSVEPGTLGDDLARRDFTVNAMALPLAGGGLVDPHGGAADCDARLVRALRPDAFEEDPSRLVRAARYAARLGFALEPGTEAAARTAAPPLDPGSARVGDELRRLLGEDAAPGALALLGDLGVPWIAGNAGRGLAALDAAGDQPAAPDVPRWALRLGAAVSPAVLPLLAVPGWARATGREAAEGVVLAQALGRARRPSETDRALRSAPPATQIGALAHGAEAVALWWAGDRDRAPEVRGSDLVAAGVAPGPAIGRALAAVRAAVLDGEVGGRDDELTMALRIAREDA